MQEQKHELASVIHPSFHSLLSPQKAAQGAAEEF